MRRFLSNFIISFTCIFPAKVTGTDVDDFFYYRCTNCVQSMTGLRQRCAVGGHVRMRTQIRIKFTIRGRTADARSFNRCGRGLTRTGAAH